MGSVPPASVHAASQGLASEEHCSEIEPIHEVQLGEGAENADGGFHTNYPRCSVSPWAVPPGPGVW